MLGYPGNPLQLSAESTDNNEGDVNKITFESVLRGSRIAFYGGAMPPVDGIAALAGSGEEPSV